MGHVSVRHAESGDAEAIHKILSGPRATADTLQMPLQSVEGVRKRFFSKTRGGSTIWWPVWRRRWSGT